MCSLEGPADIHTVYRNLLFSLLQVGQEIEVRPGIVSKTQDGKIQCTPIFSCIVSLFAEQNELQYAVPGGLIGKIIIIEVFSVVYSSLNLSCMCVAGWRKLHRRKLLED